MHKSENIDKLATALSKAQGEIEGAKKGAENPFYKSQYADLHSCWEAIREPLGKNGLSVTQLVGRYEDKCIRVETILMHTSGQWISGESSIPLSKQDAHGAGSAITYARRYSLAGIVGLVQVDDDGNASLKGKGKGTHSPTDGAMEELTEIERKRAKNISESIVDLFAEEKPIEAYELFYENDLSNEMKTGVWHLLKPHSAIRRELKSMKDEENIASGIEQATLNGG